MRPTSHLNQTNASQVFVDYSATQSRIIGLGLIIIWPFAAFCNGFGIAYAVEIAAIGSNFFVGNGIWAPIPAFVAGWFAMMAAEHKTKCCIRGAMAFAVVSIPFNLALFAAGLSAMMWRAHDEKNRVRFWLGFMYVVQFVLLMGLSAWLISLCSCCSCLQRAVVGPTIEPTIADQARTASIAMVPQPTYNYSIDDMNSYGETDVYPYSAECETSLDILEDYDPPSLHSEYTAFPKY